MTGRNRLGAVLTVAGFVFLSAHAWLESHWYQQRLMDRCDAEQEASREMLKDKNWDLERVQTFITSPGSHIANVSTERSRFQVHTTKTG